MSSGWNKGTGDCATKIAFNLGPEAYESVPPDSAELFPGRVGRACKGKSSCPGRRACAGGRCILAGIVPETPSMEGESCAIDLDEGRDKRGIMQVRTVKRCGGEEER